MIIKVDGKSQTLVQVTNESTGNAIGLYLIPEGISIERFEEEIQKAEDQNDFDETNSLGVQRIFAYDSILPLNF